MKSFGKKLLVLFLFCLIISEKFTSLQIKKINLKRKFESETKNEIKSQNQKKYKTKSIMRELKNIEKFKSFFKGFIFKLLTNLANSQLGIQDLKSTIENILQISSDQVMGTCTNKAFKYYQNYIISELEKKGKRAGILDEIYNIDEKGGVLRNEVRKRCETLKNSIKDGSLKEDGFFSKLGKGLLNLVSKIPVPDFMSNLTSKSFSSDVQSYIQNNYEYIKGKLSKDNLEYFKKVQNKVTKEDTQDFLKKAIKNLDGIFVDDNICEVLDEFADISTSLIIEASIMGGFEGFKCGGEIIKTFKDVEISLSKLKDSVLDLKKLPDEYNRTFSNENLSNLLNNRVQIR